MLPMAEVFMPMSRVAKLERAGLRRPSGEMLRELVGGRCETQSWTRRETEGLERRLMVFFEDGFVVMMIIGPWGSMLPDEKGVEGRYV